MNVMLVLWTLQTLVRVDDCIELMLRYRWRDAITLLAGLEERSQCRATKEDEYHAKNGCIFNACSKTEAA